MELILRVPQPKARDRFLRLALLVGKVAQASKRPRCSVMNDSNFPILNSIVEIRIGAFAKKHFLEISCVRFRHLAASKTQIVSTCATQLISIVDEFSKMDEFPCMQPCLFKKFAPASIGGFFQILDKSGWKGQRNSTGSVLVLLNGLHVSVFQYGHDDDKWPEMNLVKVINDPALVNFDFLLRHLQIRRSRKYQFSTQRFPVFHEIIQFEEE